jgi:hypothetical protein
LRLNPAGTMAEDTSSPQTHDHEGGGGRPGRGPGGRESGGFRIRLSDNEMRAARSVQEAFGLRSTVAVLGFCLRSMAQQLEEGKLEELLAQHRSQAGRRGGDRFGDRRGEREEPRGRGPRVDPFARPSRPAPAPAPEAADAEPSETAGATESAETADTPQPAGDDTVLA